MDRIKVYSIGEVSELLQITPRTLYAYIKAGKLEAIKMGKSWRVKHEAIEKFLNKGTSQEKQGAEGSEN